MQTIEFANGDRMPALGLGTWKSEPGEVGAAVTEALRIGYRHFDCATIYGNEAEIGDAFQRAFDDGVCRRDDLWITSKLWCNAHRAEDVVPAIAESIERLRAEYLDLYLVHWPVAIKAGVMGPSEPSEFYSLDEVPLSETWGGMEQAAELGLARHIGVSNYSAKKLDAHRDCRIRPEVDQVELHPYLQQTELLAYARDNGVVMTAYSPLGSSDRPEGLREADEPVLLEDPALASVAERVGATPAQVLIAWALQRGTSVIPKSVNPERLAQNFAAAEITLPDDAMADLAAMDRGRRYVTGAFWAARGGPYPVDELWDE
ncbi:MAG: aldo/keto reductase [Planctomycetota bacterium]